MSVNVYHGSVAFDVTRTPVSELRQPRTAIMVNVGTPEMAFRDAMQPQAGVGLARMEFIISEHIGVHPMALAQAGEDHLGQGQGCDRSPGRQATKALRFLHRDGCRRASARLPRHSIRKPVIVRLSDFKTNEYASLLGGEAFEPKEENPMLGFRGASRYSHPAYAEGFALECAALRRVREEMGLTNLLHHGALLPNVEEGRRVIATMADQRAEAR